MITAADFQEPAETSRGNALEPVRPFCRKLFREGVECLLAGDVDIGETTIIIMVSDGKGPGPLSLIPFHKSRTNSASQGVSKEKENELEHCQQFRPLEFGHGRGRESGRFSLQSLTRLRILGKLNSRNGSLILHQQCAPFFQFQWLKTVSVPPGNPIYNPHRTR